MIIVSSISNFEWYQNYFKRQLKKQSIVFYDFLGSLCTDTKSAINFLINIEKVGILNVAFNYSCFIQMFECIQKYLKINSNNWIDLSKSPKKRNSTKATYWATLLYIIRQYFSYLNVRTSRVRLNRMGRFGRKATESSHAKNERLHFKN